MPHSLTKVVLNQSTRQISTIGKDMIKNTLIQINYMPPQGMDCMVPLWRRRPQLKKILLLLKCQKKFKKNHMNLQIPTLCTAEQQRMGEPTSTGKDHVPKKKQHGHRHQSLQQMIILNSDSTHQIIKRVINMYNMLDFKGVFNPIKRANNRTYDTNIVKIPIQCYDFDTSY